MKKSLIITDNLEEKSNKNSNSDLMTNDNINFDELAQKAFAPSAGEADFENLFAAVFSLDEWYFIADAEFQYKMPYCALFPDFFGDATALRFLPTPNGHGNLSRKGITNSARRTADKFKFGDLTATLHRRFDFEYFNDRQFLDFFEKLFPLGIVKIFFNPNKDSHGFHHDLKMMRPI